MWEFLVHTGGRNFTGTAPLTWPSRWLGLPHRVGPLGKVTSFDRCIIIARLFRLRRPGQAAKSKNHDKEDTNEERGRHGSSWGGHSIFWFVHVDVTNERRRRLEEELDQACFAISHSVASCSQSKVARKPRDPTNLTVPVNGRNHPRRGPGPVK